MNRMNIVCLGVKDIKKSIKFYRDGLGFETDEKSDSPDIVFFNTSGTKLELYPLDLLREDIGIDESINNKGFSGVTFAYNAKSKEEVEKIIELARKAGGEIIKEPQDVFWGGYHGYFRDPDGYHWEVAWSEDTEFDSEDMIIL